MAIVVRNGSKRFQKFIPVLDNLNLTVENASIYGLLGASGCGKTTLLSCIVGLKQLDNGRITVLGEKPVLGVGIGYMPQDIALYDSLNIRETLWLYGLIYNMKQSEIEERTKFLCGFLELPNLSKLIFSLSGGQLRRVSIAVALIHNPRLVVLDEPTVGLDPLLRENIWQHLKELVKKERTSILITTHYQEEARFCNRIGVMRRGKLIVEQNPAMLLTQQNTDSLETAVLELCKKDEKSVAKQETFSVVQNSNDKYNGKHVHLKDFRKISNVDNYNNYYSSGSSNKHKTFWQMREQDITIIFALVYKTFLLYIRRPLFMWARLLLPIFNVVLQSSVMGTDPNGMKLAFVSPDWKHQNSSQDIFNFCSENVNKTTSCFQHEMSASCTFFKQFSNNEINWISAQTEDEALSKIHLGEAAGYLNFPVNFSFNVRDRMILQRFANAEIITGSTIGLRMDRSNYISSTFLYSTLLKRYFENVQQTVENCGGDVRSLQLPFKYHSIYGNENETEGESWAQYMQPHVIIGLTFTLSNSVGLFLVLDKKAGIEDRGAVAGITFSHLAVSSILVDSVYCVFFNAEVFLVLWLFYGLHVKGSLLLAMFFVYVISLSGVAVGFLMWSLATHEMDLIMAMMLVNSLHVISTGGIWPLEAIEPFYRALCLFLPITVPMKGFRAVLSKGWSLTYPDVYIGLGVAFLWIFGGFLCSFVLYKRKLGSRG